MGSNLKGQVSPTKQKIKHYYCNKQCKFHMYASSIVSVQISLLDWRQKLFSPWRILHTSPYGPNGRPNNLPQPAWHLAELFFQTDLSWSRADLCANSYVISTPFCLLSTMPLCTCYISNIGIGCIIHNVAQGVPQQLASTSMAPRRAILLVRFELIANRSLC
jgi:hypothetical protein